MGWVNHHSFKHDRKLRRAALLINFTEGFDEPTCCLALYAVWSYVRQHQCNMHGYLRMKPLCQTYGNPMGDVGIIGGIYSSTMRESDYSGKFDAVGRNAKFIGGINSGFKKTFNTKKNILPKDTLVSLATGTVSIDKNYMAPFFNDRDIAQYLSIAFDRANGVGGSSAPNKQWAQHTFESGSPEAQVIYARLYDFCKKEFDADAIGLVKTTPPEIKKEPTLVSSTPMWKPGLMPHR